MIEAVEIKIILNVRLASIDINWEYIAVNQISILGLITAIRNP